MDHINLHELPAHILVKIFSYTRGKDLIELTAVCRLFNDLISNCNSTTAKISIAFDHTKDKDFSALLNTKRKYQRVSVNRIMDGASKIALSTLLTIQQDSIKVLELFSCHLTSLEVKYLLLSIRNFVEEITFNCTTFSDGFIHAPVGFPKLSKLEFSRCKNVQSIVTLFKYATNIQSFIATGTEIQDIKNSFSEMMTSLPNLKELNISEALFCALFRNSLFAVNSKCQLQTLIANATRLQLTPEQIKNFNEFMKHQTELKEFLLFDYQITAEFLEILLSMPHLDDLYFEICEFQVTRPVNLKSTSITKLGFRFYDHSERDIGLTELLKNCVNIKILEFRIVLLPRETISSAIGYLKHLSQLDVRSTIVNPIKIDSLVKFTSSEENPENVFEFLRLNPKLKFANIQESLMNHPKLTEVVAENKDLKVDRFVDW